MYSYMEGTNVPSYLQVLTDEQTGHFRAGYCTLPLDDSKELSYHKGKELSSHRDQKPITKRGKHVGC